MRRRTIYAAALLALAGAAAHADKLDRILFGGTFESPQTGVTLQIVCDQGTGTVLYVTTLPGHAPAVAAVPNGDPYTCPAFWSAQARREDRDKR